MDEKPQPKREGHHGMHSRGCGEFPLEMLHFLVHSLGIYASTAVHDPPRTMPLMYYACDQLFFNGICAFGSICICGASWYLEASPILCTCISCIAVATRFVYIVMRKLKRVSE